MKTLNLSKLFLASQIALIMACSENNSSEPVKNNGNAITFGTPYVNNKTKSATGDITNVDELKKHSIKVWGEKYSSTQYDANTAQNIFEQNNYTSLTWNADYNIWNYNNLVLWEDDMNYDFVGIAPEEETLNASYQEGKVTLTDIPVVQEIDNGDTKSGIDYLLSETFNSMANNSGIRGNVNLKMYHLLSRLSLYVWKKNETENNVTLKSLKIYLPKQTAKATYEEADHSGPNMNNDKWTWTGFENITNATNAEMLAASYDEYETCNTEKNIPTCTSEESAQTNAMILDKEFFISPSPKDESFYTYISTTYEIEANGVRKEITKFSRLVGFDKTTQGYRHNILICLDDNNVTFSIDTIEGWQTGNDNNDNGITNMAGHNFGFMAKQEGFDIAGVLQLNSTADMNNATFSNATIKNAEGTQTTHAEISIEGWYSSAECIGQSYGQPSATARFGKFTVTPDPKFMTSNGLYTLSITDQDNDTNTANLNVEYSDMAFTISTTETNSSFTLPFPTGSISTPIAIVWGDNTSSTILDNIITATELQHTYSSTGDFQIRIISLETDASKQQIPELNFGKYPTLKADIEGIKFDENKNGKMVKSIDTPLLNNGSNDLSSVFYGTSITTIPADVFKHYANATNLDATFANCNQLTTVPSQIFEGMGKVESLFSTFRLCTSLTAIPSGIFDEMTKVKNMQAIFRDCSSLSSLPNGIFSRQSLCTNYIQLLTNCNKLKVSKDIFIDESAGITKSNRFSQADNVVRFDNVFWSIGSELTEDYGTMPDLWNYTFPYKYGYYKSATGSTTRYFISPENILNWTNFSEIPSIWYNYKESELPENFKIVSTE